MTITQDFLEARFKQFNATCFDNKLPQVPIRLSKARTYLGQLSYKRHKNILFGWNYSDFVIRISTQTRQTEDEICDTLLHEMIHLYIASQKLKDTSAHGKVFQKIMTDLNNRFGRHIAISHRRTQKDLEMDQRRRDHYICITTFATGERGITIAAHSRIHQLWKSIPKIPQVLSTEWYMSQDPYFNRYPRSVKTKLYKITIEELKKHLQTAHPIVLKETGNKVEIIML